MICDRTAALLVTTWGNSMGIQSRTLNVPDAGNQQQQHQFNDAPSIKTTMRLSRDRKYFIVKTEIVTIKPVKYVEKVLQGPSE
jgi:hypothetical protein